MKELDKIIELRKRFPDAKMKALKKALRQAEGDPDKVGDILKNPPRHRLMRAGRMGTDKTEDNE